MRKFNRIIIDIISHDKQRYETVGDYFVDPNGDLHIYVSDFKDVRFSYLIGIHELIESLNTEYNGVMEEKITEFDEEFESKRVEGNVDEPGDDPLAPYEKEHCIATSVERLMAAELEVKWKEYEEACNKLHK